MECAVAGPEDDGRSRFGGSGDVLCRRSFRTPLRSAEPHRRAWIDVGDALVGLLAPPRRKLPALLHFGSLHGWDGELDEPSAQANDPIGIVAKRACGGASGPGTLLAKQVSARGFSPDDAARKTHPLIRSGSHQIGLSSDRGPRDGQGHRRGAMAATRGSVAQPKRFCGKGGPCRGDLWQGKGNLGFAEMAMAQFSSPRRRLAHEIDQITGTRPAWLCHGG
jgi:hypothetical protein